ncbi:hypothetical protein LCGC14_2230070, partial [marine sediment metagenome]
MSRNVTKAVFPVAGLGTRFLPATKSIPKEIMTLVDRPLIQYAIDEARAAGITEFIFVTSRLVLDGPLRPSEDAEQRGHVTLDNVGDLCSDNLGSSLFLVAVGFALIVVGSLFALGLQLCVVVLFRF